MLYTLVILSIVLVGSIGIFILYKIGSMEADWHIGNLYSRESSRIYRKLRETKDRQTFLHELELHSSSYLLFVMRG